MCASPSPQFKLTVGTAYGNYLKPVVIDNAGPQFNLTTNPSFAASYVFDIVNTYK